MNKGYTACILFIMFAGVSLDCATIVHGTSQDIVADSSPREAEVWVDGAKEGETPVKLDLDRSDNHTVKFVKEGYEEVEAEVTKSVSAWIIGNIVFGGIIGCGVDLITGGAYDLSPDRFDVKLTSLEDKGGEGALPLPGVEDSTMLGKQAIAVMPDSLAHPSESKHYEDEGTIHKLEAVLDNGNIVILSDGSTWEVDPDYADEVTRWPIGCRVSAQRGTHTTYDYLLVEVEDNLVIRAKFLNLRSGTK